MHADTKTVSVTMPQSRADAHATLHCLGMGEMGGMEHLFAAYLAHEVSAYDRFLALDSPRHPDLLAVAARHGRWLHAIDSLFGFSLPGKPAWPRRLRARTLARPLGHTLFWNRLPDRYSKVLTRTMPSIYYDHCLAWYKPRQSERANSHFHAAVACSQASKRVLALHWLFRGPVEVCLNPVLRKEKTRTEPRRFPAERPFRIGMVGRITRAKGFVLGLHALHRLARRGYDCRLHIAGDGPATDQLRTEAARLGVEKRLHIEGSYQSIEPFYARVDCLLHPTLFDASSLVIREASAAALPVVTTRIDGIPEWFGDSAAGVMIRPALSIDEYIEHFAGCRDDIPPVSFDPDADRLVDPAAPAPEQLAEAIQQWLDRPDHFERASLAAQTLADHHGIDARSYARNLTDTLKQLNRGD